MNVLISENDEIVVSYCTHKDSLPATLPITFYRQYGYRDIGNLTIDSDKNHEYILIESKRFDLGDTILIKYLYKRTICLGQEVKTKLELITDTVTINHKGI